MSSSSPIAVEVGAGAVAKATIAMDKLLDSLHESINQVEEALQPVLFKQPPEGKPPQTTARPETCQLATQILIQGARVESACAALESIRRRLQL